MKTVGAWVIYWSTALSSKTEILVIVFSFKKRWYYVSLQMRNIPNNALKYINGFFFCNTKWKVSGCFDEFKQTSADTR